LREGAALKSKYLHNLKWEKNLGYSGVQILVTSWEKPEAEILEICVFPNLCDFEHAR
jgi:hypothetical protein